MILLPTDGLPASMEAEKKAIELAKKSGAKIKALYVIAKPKRELSGATVAEPVKAEVEKIAKKAVQKIESLGKEAGIKIETEILEGDPVDVIEGFIKKYYQEIEVVVMGCGKKSELEKFLSGSISEKVVRRISQDVYCPMMIVPEEECGGRKP